MPEDLRVRLRTQENAFGLVGSLSTRWRAMSTLVEPSRPSGAAPPASSAPTASTSRTSQAKAKNGAPPRLVRFFALTKTGEMAS